MSLAVADPTRLGPEGKWPGAVDALGVDLDHPRSLDSDGRVAEAAAPAGIANRAAGRAAVDDLASAGRAPMLELGEQNRIAEAQALPVDVGVEIPNLPAARLEPAESLDPCGRERKERRGETAGQQDAERSAAQFPPQRPHASIIAMKKAGIEIGVKISPAQRSKSLIEIGKIREQNSQSTLMNPSWSTMSARSAGSNREITPLICSRLQRQPLASGIA